MLTYRTRTRNVEHSRWLPAETFIQEGWKDQYRRNCWFIRYMPLYYPKTQTCRALCSKLFFWWPLSCMPHSVLLILTCVAVSLCSSAPQTVRWEHEMPLSLLVCPQIQGDNLFTWNLKSLLCSVRSHLCMGMVRGDRKRKPANIFQLARLRKIFVLKHNLNFAILKQVPLAGKV